MPNNDTTTSPPPHVGSTAELEDFLPLVTYDSEGRRQTVQAGDAVSVCVKRARARQMYWYPATVIRIEGGKALVALKNHAGERALLGPRSIRVRKTSPNTTNDRPSVRSI